MLIRAPRAAAAVAVTIALAACSAGGSRAAATTSAQPAGTPRSANPSPTSSTSHHASARPSFSAAPTAAATGGTASGGTTVRTAETVWKAMSERQRVGQLLMVDCPSTRVAAATVSAVTASAVGSVILDGTTTAGSAAVRSVTSALQRYAPAHTRLLIATDQEGGLVQRLQGPGFSTIPDALVQGKRLASTLRADARTWAAQLKQAGVNVNLAPVLDTVPTGGGANPPIGDLDREYGHTPATVTGKGVAVARGMADAGVAATAKHFPGLGRVTGNTDVTSGVTDRVTTRTDAYLAPFQAAVRAGVPLLMMSTAIYSRIAPGIPAAFSPTIVTGMLRGDLGYRGLIISDDLGAARQVSYLSPGQRAVRFVRAGGDIVLTVVASQARAMTSALLSAATSDPSFRRKVDAASLLVLQAKQRAGLL